MAVISEKEYDEVNHPKRYTDHCSMECIEVMTLCLGERAVCEFCLCNAFKYMWRHKQKNGEEDLEKARWYLNYVKDKLQDKPDLNEFYMRLDYLLTQTAHNYYNG